MVWRSLLYLTPSLNVGVEHNIKFAHCDCEPLIVTIVHAQLWPATPQYPRLTFCFELFDWAEALLLECQVALKDLCQALQFKNPHLVTKVCFWSVEYIWFCMS